MSATFEFPEFFEYPPYFTVQPNPDTQRKQTELWKSLILGWCQHHNSWTLRLDDETHVLFRNESINRKLPAEAKRLFIDALVNDNAALWLDDSGPKSKCLVLWKSLDSWCDELVEWSANNGLEGQIVTVDEVTQSATGPSGFKQAPIELIKSVSIVLEKRGKGVFIESSGADDAGIKLF